MGFGAIVGTFFGPIGTAVGAAFDEAYSNKKSKKAAKKDRQAIASANEQNVDLAREQMAFQERMSSTAHRREVTDLRLAGLNPILSATGGAGASTPAGSRPQVEAQDNRGQAFERFVNSALAFKQMDVLRSNARKADAETKVVEKSMPYLVDKAYSDSQTAAFQSSVMQNSAITTARDAAQAALDIDLYGGKYGQAIRVAEKLAPLANSAVDLVKGVLPMNMLKGLLTRGTK